MSSKWIRISLFFFLFVSIAGSIMRLAPFLNLPTDYKHILHSHSHVAFQGWIYISFYLLITKLYLGENIIINKKYKLQLFITIFIITGIMVSFLVQGYAIFSIIFSSLFQLLNYWFAYRFIKDVAKSEIAKRHPFSVKWIKAALLLMVISTIGPWVIAIISAKGYAGSEYFNTALYFFFHFQYNGWFTFSILGLFFWWLEHQQIKLEKLVSPLYNMMLIAIIPTYSLSLLGMSFGEKLQVVGYFSALLQLMSLIFLIISLKPSYTAIKALFNQWAFVLLVLSFYAFFLKNILQAASTLPILKQYAFLNKDLIIGYIHLTMIGFISFFLLAILFQLKWLAINKTGIILLVIGFIISEIILILLGLTPNLLLLEVLAIFSLIMAFGISLIWIKQLRH